MLRNRLASTVAMRVTGEYVTSSGDEHGVRELLVDFHEQFLSSLTGKAEQIVPRFFRPAAQNALTVLGLRYASSTEMKNHAAVPSFSNLKPARPVEVLMGVPVRRLASVTSKNSIVSVSRLTTTCAFGSTPSSALRNSATFISPPVPRTIYGQGDSMPENKTAERLIKLAHDMENLLDQFDRENKGGNATFAQQIENSETEVMSVLDAALGASDNKGAAVIGAARALRDFIRDTEKRTIRPVRLEKLPGQ
jgi:hypothetical protein